MESELSGENPTPSEGASIQDRLTAYLSAGEQSDSRPEPTEDAQATRETPQAEEVQSEQPKEGVSEQEEQPQISTTDLAKVFGLEESALDVDDEGNPVFKAKIDGKEVPAKLADLLKDYQIRGHAENKAREAAEAHKAAQARMQEVERDYQARLQHAAQLTQVAQQELAREYQSIDWNSLETQDPGRAALLKQQFAERNGRLQSVIQAAQQQQAAQMQQAQRQAEQANAQRLQAEMERLPTLIPEWKDKGVAEKESKELVDWALKAGYPREFVAGLDKGSALDIATVRKAMLYDKLQASKPAIENKVRQAPKVVKPGQAQANSKEETARSLKQAVIKSGGKGGSVAAYLLATGKV